MIALGILMASSNCLRVVIDTQRPDCPELQCGDGKNPGPTAKIDNGHTRRDRRIELTQAHRGGWVGAGTKRQTRVEHDVDRVGGRRVNPARTHPQPWTHLHRMKIIHPRQLPSLIGYVLGLLVDSADQRWGNSLNNRRQIDTLDE